MIDPARIKSLRVHPGLGIARVGNAQGHDDYVLAAEVPGGTATSHDGAYRDKEGKVRRQAVRFRLYAQLHDGSVQELTADDAAISWSVELANLKAGWYNFENAMDLPAPYAKPATRRNALEKGDARTLLDIRPGQRSIEGRSLDGPDYHFDSGKYYDKRVYLGELRTDEQGRLIVLGGRGESAPRVPGTKPTTFANNDGWHDDIADGPVYAKVRFAGGLVMDAEPGYVAVTPPNFAPGLFGVVTMADVVVGLFAGAGTPARPSFTRDIWPIFDRMTNSQWVNHGLFMLAGHGSPLNARDPAVALRLADATEANRAFRHTVFGMFRDPDNNAAAPDAIPGFYSDYYGDYTDERTDSMSVTAHIYQQLAAWATGDFDSDWKGEPALPQFADLGPAAQAAALDRAGLYECLGGPFHPGIELTWIMRTPGLWRAPFRLKVAPQGQPGKQDYGDQLTPDVCLAANGPLDGVYPGSLTRTLGLPWQTDEASCLSDGDYQPSTFLSFPSFWGARVPNRVLSIQAWERVNSERSNPTQQLKNFVSREDWLRDLRGSYQAKITMMVENWWELGILVPHAADAPARALGLPALAWIETGRPEKVTGTNAKGQLLAAIDALGHPLILSDTESVTAPAVRPRRHLRRDEI